MFRSVLNIPLENSKSFLVGGYYIYKNSNTRRFRGMASVKISELDSYLLNTFTAEGFSETRHFMHLSSHIFGSY